MSWCIIQALATAVLLLVCSPGGVTADDACSPVDPCKGQGKACRDAKGSADCYKCLPGWNATYTEVPKNSTEKPALICTAPAVCKTSDACKSLNKICTADQDGKAVCGACLVGYQKDPSKGDSAACIDIDECKVAPDLCVIDQRPCTNKAGGYQCGACFDGWVEGGDGLCVDVDECAPADNPCAKQGRFCDNFLEGKGYECRSCKNNYIESGGVCVKQTCSSVQCVTNTKCVDSDDGPQCVCPPPLIGDSSYCDCADGYKLSRGSCVDVCNVEWPCDPQTDNLGYHIAICNLGSCSCPILGWSGTGTPDAPCQATGCYPGKAKVWARSSATAKPQKINIKDLRTGDYVRCMTSPIEKNFDYPAELSWCLVKDWTHANSTRTHGMMKVNFKRKDGTTGHHVLTRPHFVYLLPNITKVGTRFASLETIEGHLERPLDLKKGDIMAAAVVTSNPGEYDGFEAVQITSCVDYNNNNTIGWYLPAIESPYMIVDDVVASNTLVLYGWEPIFPTDTYRKANRFWFASTAQEQTCITPFYAPVGTTGEMWEKVKVYISVNAHGQRIQDIRRLVASKVKEECYSFDLDHCFWPWFLEVVKAHKAAPTAPANVVQEPAVAAKLVECLVPPPKGQPCHAAAAGNVAKLH